MFHVHGSEEIKIPKFHLTQSNKMISFNIHLNSEYILQGFKTNYEKYLVPYNSQK